MQAAGLDLDLMNVKGLGQQQVVVTDEQRHQVESKQEGHCLLLHLRYMVASHSQ